MTIRVKVIIAVCLAVAYFFIDGLSMARYQRLHSTGIDCDALTEFQSRYECRRDMRSSGTKAFWAGIGWPAYIVVSFGIEAGEKYSD